MKLINVLRFCSKFESLKASRFFNKIGSVASSTKFLWLLLIGCSRSNLFHWLLPFLGIRNESGQTIKLTELYQYINVPKTTDCRLYVIIIAYRAVRTTEWSNVSICIFTFCLRESNHDIFHVKKAICFRMKRTFFTIYELVNDL